MWKKRKKSRKSRTEKCRINGKKVKKQVVHKTTSNTGQRFGYVRQDSTFIQVTQRKNGVWDTPKRGIWRLVFGA
jgi:hypothetical protein